MLSLLTLFKKEYKYKDDYLTGSYLTLHYLRCHNSGITCFVSNHSDDDAIEKRTLRIVESYDISKDIFNVEGDSNKYRYTVPVNHLAKPINLKK